MGIPLTLSEVPALTPYVQYVATMGQTVYPYPFPITQDSDLVVVINGVTLATDAGYTVSGQGNDTGGNITLSVGSTAGDIITMYRNILIERITQIGQNSGFSSTAFNAEFNNIYLIMQQLQEGNSLSLRIPITNTPLGTTLLTPAAYANKYLGFDANGNPTPAILTPSGSITGALLAGLLNVVTTIAPIASLLTSAAETTAGVTPVNFAYPVGDVRRYGAVLNGVTDDTIPLKNWAKVGGKLVFPTAQTALITSAIPLVSNSTLEFASGATIKTATTDINMLTMASLSNVIVRGGAFLSTVGHTSVQTGGIYMTGCSNCVVEYCTFNGMQYTGILGYSGITYCTFRGNYFVNARSAQLNEGADINIMTASGNPSNYNIIDGNFCFGGGEFGIAVWDPYAGVLPLHNTICNNRVGGSSGYGILIYTTISGDSWNQIIGNHVDTIYGNIASNTSSGNGIYVEGSGCGGTLIANNTIQNCCIDTANATLAPAGIGINGGPVAGGTPLVITGNSIQGMTQYNGILATGSDNIVINNNSVVMPATQGANIGHAIMAENCNSASITGNVINLLSTTITNHGIALAANGGNYGDIAITGNAIRGGHSGQIRIIALGNLYERVVISSNVCANGDASSTPLLLDTSSCIDVLITGNSFQSGGAVAVNQAACTNVRYTNNYLTGSGAILTTSGACSGSFFDRTNTGTGTGAGIANAGTGFIIEQLGTAVPSTGTWAVGDTVRNSAPSTGGVYEWINTVAGSPGTWKTISNT